MWDVWQGPFKCPQENPQTIPTTFTVLSVTDRIYSPARSSRVVDHAHKQSLVFCLPTLSGLASGSRSANRLNHWLMSWAARPPAVGRSAD